MKKIFTFFALLFLPFIAMANPTLDILSDGDASLYKQIFELQDKEKINYRLDGVEELFKNTLIRQGIAEILCSMSDIERIAGKISNNNITPKDCLSLGNSLSLIPSIIFQLSGMGSAILNDVASNMGDYTVLAKLLNDAISEDASSAVKDGGYIKSGFDTDLDELRSIKSNVKYKLAAMEAAEKEFPAMAEKYFDINAKELLKI